MADYTIQISAGNSREAPVVETDFYKWLGQGNYNDYAVQAVKNYLGSYGWVKGQDTISPELLSTLKTIHNFYFCDEIAPTQHRRNF